MDSLPPTSAKLAPDPCAPFYAGDHALSGVPFVNLVITLSSQQNAMSASGTRALPQRNIHSSCVCSGSGRFYAAPMVYCILINVWLPPPGNAFKPVKPESSCGRTKKTSLRAKSQTASAGHEITRARSRATCALGAGPALGRRSCRQHVHAVLACSVRGRDT